VSDHYARDLGERRRNLGFTVSSHGLPTVGSARHEGASAMSTTTTERPIDIWVCPNCRTETEAPRKRCTDCGTSRY